MRRGKATEKLNELRKREIERRGEERKIDSEREAAEREVAEASTALTVVLADDGDSRAAMRRLEKAKVAAARPWKELREAGQLKVRRARGEVERFAQEHSAELWEDHRPKAEEAAARVDRLLAETVKAIKAVDQVETEAGDLLRLQGRGNEHVPLRGLESLYNDLRRRLAAQTTPPPVPREPATYTIDPPPAGLEELGPRAA
jgi:hypothetical protein